MILEHIVESSEDTDLSNKPFVSFKGKKKFKRKNLYLKKH